MIELETKVKDKLKRNGKFGIVNNIDGFLKRVTKKLSVTAPGRTKTNSLSYEASEAHKTHTMEVERRRAQALMEARRHNLRAR